MSKAWIPAMPRMRESQELALGVMMPESRQMTRDLHRQLLRDKLVTLIREEDSLQQAARIAQELVPDSALVWTQSAEDMADSLIQHEAMGELLTKIDWPSSPRQIPQRDARESLSEQNLMTILEALPRAEPR